GSICDAACLARESPSRLDTAGDRAAGAREYRLRPLPLCGGWVGGIGGEPGCNQLSPRSQGADGREAGLTRGTIRFLWRDNSVADGFRTGVSLHSHTMHSHEGLGFVASYAS